MVASRIESQTKEDAAVEGRIVDPSRCESLFPPGTPVRVTEAVPFRGRYRRNEVVGVVERWEQRPTGSWYAHGKNDRLWLRRLVLRKADGEITTLVVDDQTAIAKLEPAKT